LPPVQPPACSSLVRSAPLSLAANAVVALLALVHIYILVLEMFWWDKPAGLRALGLPQELATAPKVLGAN
jgi:putative membrane protein